MPRRSRESDKKSDSKGKPAKKGRNLVESDESLRRRLPGDKTECKQTVTNVFKIKV